ncbi:MAG: hypothetical protein JXD22_05260 [Sedimentisphaerales bacterium]|nr:hypothetical protein [Sedimentisphaerales bacterium]
MGKHCNFLAWFLIGIVTFVFWGCRKPGGDERPGCGDEQSSGREIYEPGDDPLVNPAALFEPRPRDLEKIARDEELCIRLDREPRTLNPLFVADRSGFVIVNALFAGLFRVGSDMSLQINREMVENLEESADHREVLVRLREGLKWHDGEPFTAADVVYSWREINDSQGPCYYHKVGAGAVSECVAVDELTVKFVQSDPTATRLWNLFFPIIPKHVFEKEKERYPDLVSGEYYQEQVRWPIGNGPYRMVQWQLNNRIILERWEGYAGEKPDFKRMVFKVIPDDRMALILFEKQQVDVIDRLGAGLFALEANSEVFERVGCKAYGERWKFYYIGWNMDGSNPFFVDRNVRYAMTCALDVPGILRKVYYNLYSAGTGIYHPDSELFNREVEMLKFDPEGAGRLLDVAGWEVDAADGWRYKEIGGEKKLFEFSLLVPQQIVAASQVAAIFQHDLAKLGVRMKVRRLEWVAFLEKIRNHEFQAELGFWNPGVDPDKDAKLWCSDQYADGRNYIGYANEQVDKLFGRGREEFDPVKRRVIYQQIHKIIYEDQPFTWICNDATLAVFNKRIRGVELSPRGVFNFYPGIRRWWIPAELATDSAGFGN